VRPAASNFRNAGTSQAERLAPALLAPPPLDGRSLHELLAYATQFSQQIPFYQHPDVVPEDQWQLDQHRSLLLLALVTAQPSEHRADEYAQRLQPLTDPVASAAQQQAGRQALLQLLRQEADRLISWRLHYHLDDSQQAFVAALRQALANLSPLLRQAARYEAALLEAGLLSGPPQLGQKFVAHLDAANDHLAEPLLEDAETGWPAANAWRQLDGALAARLLDYTHGLRPNPLLPPEGLTAAQAAARITTDLTWLFWQVHKEQTNVQRVAKQELHHYLTTRDDNHPEIGLLVTFMQLYGHAQQALNAIPSRHLTYYYEEVLQTAARPSQADTAYLTFRLAQGCRQLLLPAGTLVDGGKDAQGRRIVFATAADAELGDWRVEALTTLLVARQPATLPALEPGPLAPGPPAGVVTGVYTTAPNGPAPGLSAEASGWPLFGEDPSLNQAAAYPSVPARLGFAVAAPVLGLAEGQRTITLELRVAAAEQDRLRQRMAGQGGAEPLPAMLFEAFRVQATGPAGWIPATTLDVQAQGDTITWTLQLDRTQPAVVAYEAVRHGGNFATTQPMLQLLLNPEATTYAYSYLATLEPLTITLRVNVLHLHKVGLGNQLSRLSPSAPFYPFGAQVMPGDYLTVSVPELMGKNLQEVTLALTWQNLPPMGFADYYAGYGVAFADTDFVVTPSYLADYHWQRGQPQHLFNTSPSDLAMQPLQLLHLHQPGRLTPAADGTGGLLRLELTGPAQGFGTPLYQTALTSTVRYNARHPADPLALPRPPFLPQLNHLTVSYKAEESFLPGLWESPLAEARFFHLHPLAEYEPAGTGPLQLLPDLPDEGTLLVGLSAGAAGQLVSLVFDLTVLQEADLKVPLPHWHYLYQDEWRSVPVSALPENMPGFANSCQVQVRLPAEAGTTTHSLLPSGQCWLRATVPPPATPAAGPLGATRLGQVQALYAQLVPAVRTTIDTPPPAPYQEPLPAGRLTRLPRAVPGIAGVAQPRPSFGGRVAEGHSGYYTRVSEQLRHRSRALVPWDYERLILERFPDVYSAKCLTADQLPPPRVPGQVLLLVLPRPDLVPGHPRPLFGASQLAEMQQYVQQLASPTVQLQVRNPSYELVQVRGWVKFKAPLAGSARLHYEQQLQHDVSAFLAPWQPKHPQKGGFHRLLTLTTIEAFLNQLPYIESIASVSAVKTGLLDGLHRFYDSAALGKPEPSSATKLGALVPWAVLVAADQHVFEVGPAPDKPQPTGVGQLRVEQDFVVACDF
jgi:hypothetical protein